jgi:hypothetical protein
MTILPWKGLEHLFENDFYVVRAILTIKSDMFSLLSSTGQAPLGKVVPFSWEGKQQLSKKTFFVGAGRPDDRPGCVLPAIGHRAGA